MRNDYEQCRTRLEVAYRSAKVASAHLEEAERIGDATWLDRAKRAYDRAHDEYDEAKQAFDAARCREGVYRGMASERGFSLLELMMVVVILGVIAAAVLPNFASMQDNARNGSLKANMLALVDRAYAYAAEHDGRFPASARELVGGLADPAAPGATPIDQPAGTVDPNLGGVRGGDDSPMPPNPWTGSRNEGEAWEWRSDMSVAPSAVKGLVSYSGDANGFNIKAYGSHGELSLVLTSGEGEE